MRNLLGELRQDWSHIYGSSRGGFNWPSKLRNGSSSLKELKKELLNVDFTNLLEESKTHPTSLAAKIATSS